MHSSRPSRRSSSRRYSARSATGPGLYYDRSFVAPEDRRELVEWLGQIHPIWEDRYSKHNPPPNGKEQRRLLRPVYWLGSWQFACLDYYHPPKATVNRCVRAEPFPAVISRLVARIERVARDLYHGADMPKGWKLNVCLVNFYGSRIESDGKCVDSARVGEHKDFEPGPVASLSLGERALFQFVSSGRPGIRATVVAEQWLEDGALQIFGGERWKNRLFHRVQRVDSRHGFKFKLNVEGFETRRINLTFRYVPDADVVHFADLPRDLAEDVRAYVERLALHSPFFTAELKARIKQG